MFDKLWKLTALVSSLQQPRQEENGNTEGVSYFKQFPPNFLVPYGPAIDATDDSKLGKYLKPFNCELLLRPAVFFSEFNATLAENCKILRQDRRDESGLLNGADNLKKFLKENEKLQKKMAPMGKESTEVAIRKDVVCYSLSRVARR